MKPSTDDMWRWCMAEIERREIMVLAVSPVFIPALRAEIAMLTEIRAVIDRAGQRKAA